MEDPLHLLRRLRLGREEYCQRLLTMLIVGGPYPRWNSRTQPSPRGARFLRSLDELSFGPGEWNGQPVFVDEFELRPRHEDEQGGAPDYAVLWDERLWMIELKTETSSHRRGQISGYYTLAAHHHPGIAVNLTYLTPPFPFTPPAAWDGTRFAHVTWSRILPLLRAAWGAGDDAEQQVLAGLLAALDDLGTAWSDWRAQRVRTPQDSPAEGAAMTPAECGPGAIAETPMVLGSASIEHAAMALAEATARDGRQRAVHHPTAGLDELHRLRLALRQAICAAPDPSPIRHVRPWLWRVATSGGTALTASGRETGFEVRLSRYRKPVC